jgi:hypothetical protein
MFMKKQNDHTSEPLVKKSRFGLRHIIGLVALVILVTALVTVWWVNRYIYASEFTPRPYYLAQRNECSMQNWRHWDAAAHDDLVVPTKKRKKEGRPVVPEAYSEKGDKRELNLTEKEVNALIANNNPKVAQRVAIDLSGNLVSVKLVVPMGDEIPLLGEKTLRLAVSRKMEGRWSY